MVVRQVADVRGDRKQFIEELLGQPLGENQQVYILVWSEEAPDRCVSTRATGRGEEWSAAKNERRGELIDKYIQASIEPDERVELEFLQQQFYEYRHTKWPLPIDKARELHRELLEKKRQQEQAQE